MDAINPAPQDIPPTKGLRAKVTTQVDSDHARCEVTRRSVTGILVIINGMVVKHISKGQSMVECSTCGTELVAAWHVIDAAIDVCYDIRAMGIPLEDAVIVFGDNKSVVVNTTLPSSQLKKKHLSCAYHRIWEMIAS